MGERKASWYSVVRYTADALAGETINVGIIMHIVEGNGDSAFKHLLINEQSQKIKAITESVSEERLYKSFKDSLEYYLQESVNDLFGNVGEVSIGSPSNDDFLTKLYDYYKDQKMFITRPKFSLTSNTDALFENLFETYIGSKYLPTETNKVNTVRYVRQILEEKELLNKKVISGHVLKPLEELSNVEIKIDFTFKNGVWNYMQGVPSIELPHQNTEWLLKTKFMIENVEEDSKIKLLHRNDEDNEEFNSMVTYLSNINKNIDKVNIDNKQQMNQLLSQIQDEAQDINELKIS